MPEEIIPKKKIKPEKGQVQKDIEQIIKKTAEAKSPESVLRQGRIKSIVSFSVFCLAIILLVFLIGFSFLRIKKESSDFLAARNQVAVLTGQSVDVENFKNNYDSYKPNFEKIDAMFIDQHNPLGIIQFLEKSAVLAKIDISISPPSFSQEGGQKFLNLQVSCTGPLSGELEFLKKIEEGPYLVSVQSVALSGLQSGTAGQKGSAIQQPRATLSVRALSR